VSDHQPWSYDVELELIGASFIDANTLDTMQEFIGPEDFYHVRHQAAHRAQIAVWSRARRIDMPLVVAELERQGKPPDVARDTILGSLDKTGSTANLESHCKVLVEMSTLRWVIDTCQRVAHEAQQQPDDVDAFVCSAEARMRDVAERRTHSRIQSASDGVPAAMERIYKAKEGDESVLGLYTGFRQIDRALEGLQDGLNIVAGRPGNGKSALALQMVRNVAGQNKGVFVWSGEMPEPKVWTRLLAAEARYCFKDLFGRSAVDPSDWERIQQASYAIESLPIELDCQAGLTAQQVCVRAQRARRKLEEQGKELWLVVIDHFHKLNHGIDGKRDDAKMNASTKHIADWAKGQGLPVLLPTQFNREAGKRGHEMPKLHDLRECGALEEEAETVIATHLAWHHSDTYRVGDAKVPVLKNRGGEMQVILDYHFDGPTMRFSERYHE